MTIGDIAGAVGIVAALIGLLGAAVARDRYVMRLISDQGKELHERVNRVRDEYVRRVDLDGHIGRLESNMRELRDELKANHKDMNSRLDALIAAVNRKN